MFIYPCFGLYKYRTRGRCTVLYCKLPSAKKMLNVTCKALKPNLNLLSRGMLIYGYFGQSRKFGAGVFGIAIHVMKDRPIFL